MLCFDNGVQAQVQLPGSEAEGPGTWLWAWANEQSQLPPALVEAALALRAYGEQHGIVEFTEPALRLEEVDGYTRVGNTIDPGIINRDNFDNALGTWKSQKGVDPIYKDKDGNEGDEGGHMIASVLGGIGERLNVFPQNWKLNRGKGSDWRKMEKHWLKLAQEGKEVRVTMHFKYGDPQNPGRPTEIEVVETVEGRLPTTYDFKNEAPQ